MNKIKQLKKPELMAPVADQVMLKAAIKGGADAVYFGLKNLNMRSTAQNFDIQQLKTIIKECHENKIKAYLTINTIVFDEEIEQMKRFIEEAKGEDVDGIIAWDMSVIKVCKEKKVPVFLSTQASVANSASARYYQKLGIKRIVLARECNIPRISAIKKANPKLEIEVFIHGAMCVSVSGRCLISHELFQRSANRGDCLQPCRREYRIKDMENEIELQVGPGYVLSPKDLCTIMFIERIIETGVDSLKIEGRNRTPEYVQAVTGAYRKAIDYYFEHKDEENFNQEYEKIKKELFKQMEKVYNRGFSNGFFMNEPGALDWTTAYGSSAKTKKEFLGTVIKYYERIGVAEIRLETTKLTKGDHIMTQGPKTGVNEGIVESMQLENKPVITAKKGTVIGLKTNSKVRPKDKVFIIRESVKE